MKITKSILAKKLKFLCDALGKRTGFNPGEWGLDYAPLYGGYIVVEYEERGGESHPLLNKRLTASQMADALDMALGAVRAVGASMLARGGLT